MGILAGLGHLLGSRPPFDEALRPAIERAVQLVDPLLKTVSAYERKLAPAVSDALDHCERLAAEVPGPVDVSSRAFSADPLVHALFAAPGDIGDMLGKSRELREFLVDPAYCDGDDFFALLGMRQREKAVTGMALQGEMLRVDVPQRLLYFADHTLGELGGDVETTRQRLKAAAFDGLAQGFAERVAALRKEREEARTEWSMEQAGAELGRVERRQVLEERQRQATAALNPAAMLNDFVEWLAAAETRLYLKPTVVTVDRMGVISPHPEAGGNFNTLNFPELVGRDRRHWIVMVARISRQDAVDALQRQQQANRYLII
jgi:hypothetical protein